MTCGGTRVSTHIIVKWTLNLSTAVRAVFAVKRNQAALKTRSLFKAQKQSQGNPLGVLMSNNVNQSKVSLGLTASVCDVQYLRRSI